MFRLGIAGIGTIANNYIGLIADGKVSGVEIAALCSHNLDHMQAVSEKYALGASLYQSHEELLAYHRLDGVLICTPHGLHLRMTKSVLEAGLHVLTEKPVGIFCDEAEEALAEQRKHPELVCGVLYNRRAAKAFRYVKNVLEAGRIGELVRCTWIITNLYRTNAYYASGSWRGTWQGEGGGLLMTQASHQLDLLQWLCGMPRSVLARCSTINRPIQVENEAELFFSYPNGAHGHFIASAHETPGTNLLEICGTKGRITVRDDKDIELIYLDKDERDHTKTCAGPFEGITSQKEQISFDDSDDKIQHAATIQNFIQAAKGEAVIQCSLEEGLRSLQIIHGAYLSGWQEKSIALPADKGEFRAFMEKRTNPGC